MVFGPALLKVCFVMLSGGHEKTVVRRVTVKGRKLDPLAAQLRLDNLFQTIEMHPSWLPASAIVCLRQIRDPLPRTLELQNRTATQSLVWQHAVSTAVQEKIRCAVRPVNAEVSSEATSVIFRDQGELLACLAMDWAEDRLGSRWWWRSLFKVHDVAGIVPDAWASSPQYVPAALELLATRHRLKPFARALSIHQARLLLREVTQTFALQELQSALEEGFELACGGPDRGKTTAPQFHSASVSSNATTPPPTPPWRPFMAEGLDQTLGIERQCLIGVALTIRRAPGAARSSQFARATLNWLRAVGADKTNGPGNSNESQRGSAAVNEEGTARASAREQTQGLLNRTSGEIASIPRESFLPEPNPLAPETTRPAPKKEFSGDAKEYEPPNSSSSSDRHMTAGSDGAGAPARQTSPASTPTVHPREALAPGLSNSTTLREEAARADFAETSSFEAASDTTSEFLALDEVRIETAFGGIFYLVNVGLFLELYCDFTMPAGENLGLSIFDFVALIGRRLLDEQLKDDPVWELLAQLAGRSELDVPGKDFEPPEEWRLPAQWLEAFPEKGPLEWAVEGRRLLVKHSAGFLILDVPLAGDPAEQLEREMMVYKVRADEELNRTSFTFSRNGSSLEQWLGWVTPYIRARLRRALGEPDGFDPALVLCAQHASIVLTEVHLDIFFALSDHPVAIRLAGLDHDPGWVPAAGRFVRFHYQ
ncbi:MAG: hypothetical protein QOH41_2241 [Blastocatellia bacterium]|jgi:hypothetical protein|nr:hypothetical protein [Blastocatellia bacterium]